MPYVASWKKQSRNMSLLKSSFKKGVQEKRENLPKKLRKCRLGGQFGGFHPLYVTKERNSFQGGRETGKGDKEDGRLIK